MNKLTFATTSYTNPYDKIYEALKFNKNFKSDMWNVSAREGNLDIYATLLDKTKTTKFREEFYNPQYYDYNTMMLEMAKENYDDTEKSLSKRDTIFFNEDGTYYEGKTEEEYTDKQWAEYQLNQAYEQRRQEIAAQVEKERKDNMHWLEKVGASILSVGGEFLEGITTGVTGFLDYIAANYYSMYKTVVEGQNPLDAFVEYFGKGLTALEKETFRKALDEYESKNSIWRNLDGSYTNLGKYATGITNSIGMMLPSIVTNIVAPGSGSILFYTSIFGNNMYETEINTLIKGSPSRLKITNNVLKTSAEYAIEWGLGKMLGSTVGNKLLGINGNFKIGDIKRLGANVLFKSAAQEGLEEVLQDFSTGLVNTFTGMIHNGYGNQGIGGEEGVTFQSLFDSFVMGVASSLILSGVSSVSNTIKTKSEARIEAKIEKGLKDGSLIEKEDGTIVDKNGNKVYDSKYITPRIEVDGKLEAVSGLTRFVYNDLVQNFKEAISQLQEGKGNIKLAQEVYTAFNQLASLYKSFGDERLSNARKILDEFENNTNKNNIVINSKNYSAYMTNEFNDMVSKVSQRLNNKKLGEEAKIKIEKASKELESTNTKSIVGVATKTDTVLKDEEGISISDIEKQIIDKSKTKKTKINKNKVDDILKEYDWVFVTDGNEPVQIDENTIFVPESWLSNYSKTEIYEFIQQNNITKNIRSYTGLLPLLNYIDKVYEDLSGNKITSKNIDEGLVNFLFNEKFYQYVLFSNIDKKSSISKYGATEFKKHIFRIYTIFNELAQKAKNDLNKNLINKIKREMINAQRKPTIKAILHWNIDSQEVGADNILTKEDRDFIQQTKTLKKINSVEAISGKQISQEFLRKHQKEIDKAKKNLENKENVSYIDLKRDELILNGIKENASKLDRLKAFILLEDTTVYEKNSLITIFADAFDIKGNKADIELYNDVINNFYKEYGVTPRRAYLYLYQEYITNTKLSNDVLKEYNILYLKNRDITEQERRYFIEKSKEFIKNKLQKMLGNKYFLVDKILNNTFHNDVYKSVDISYMLKRYIENDTDFYQCFNLNNLISDIDGKYYIMNANDIIDFSKLSLPKHIDTSLYKIKLFVEGTNFSKTEPGYYDDKNKTINLYSTYGSILKTFTHEINHMFQNMFDMKLGGDPDVLSKKYIKYVEDNFSDVLEILQYNHNNNYSSDYLAYRLLEGEIFARYTGEVDKINELSLGLIRGLEDTGNEYKYFVSKSKIDVSDKAKENIANNKLYDEFNNVLTITDNLAKNTRDTYHTALTNKSVYELTNTLIKDNLSILDKATVSLDNIIKNPQKFLKDEILNQITKSERDINNEGDIYYHLKTYLENKFGNISIDREAKNNTYVFVNDNAFNDLIKDNIAEKLNDDTDLSEKYKKSVIKISDIYDISVLKSLKIPTDLEIVTGSNLSNEFIVDKEHPAGVININPEGLTNIEFVRAINHEFRHCLQYYYNFEQGFTINFNLTKEMLNDIKLHVPEIFTDKDNLEFARIYLGEKASKNDIETFIAKTFIYYMTGGEQQAYGIKANYLMNKPIYVRYDGGNPTIFMPWYDGENGKYETDFIANRAVNKYTKIYNKELVDKGTVFSSNKKYGKFIETNLPSATYKNKPKEKGSRYFSNDKAKGTLLENFIKPHKQNQMDPLLQNFLIKATPLYNILPKELKQSINKGTLTSQKLYHWFRKTDNISNELFDLINKTIFKNDYIKSYKQLDTFVGIDIEKAFSLIITLMKNGIDVNVFFKENDISDINELFNLLYKDKKWGKLLEKETKNFTKYYDEDNNEDRFEITDEVKSYMKTFAMRYFDGTISSLFLMGRTFRKVARMDAEFKKKEKLSIQKHIDGRKGEGGTTLEELIDAEASNAQTPSKETKEILKVFKLSENTDLYELYEESNEIINDIDDQLDRKEKVDLLKAYKIKEFRDKLEKQGYSQKVITATLLKIEAEKIDPLIKTYSDEKVNHLYEQLKIKEMTGVDTNVVIKEDEKTDYRIDIVNKIKRRSNKIKKAISVDDWKYLPEEIKEMFDGKGAAAILKKDAYSVGYANKTTGPASLDKLIKNLKLLDEEILRIKSEKLIKEKGEKAFKNIEKAVEKKNRKEIILKSTKSTKIKNKIYETEIRVKTEKGRNDFNIYSSVPMPNIVRDIFDTSFNEMADTKVQFASRDESGKLYDKDSKEFVSAQKHEVSNWDAFYKANYEILNNLSRSEAIEIIDFIVKGNPISLDQSSGKLEAFKVFLLGYILDSARTNIWEMSQSDITQIEKYYEQLASNAGSTLNAVGQMIKVVNPLKQVKQLMLGKYNVLPEQVDTLKTKLDKLQSAKTEESKDKAYKEINEEIVKIETTIAENSSKKSVWERIKSLRFLNMLSAPTTWIRNTISNHIVKKFNKVSDTLGSWIFRKRDYREGQWNLASTEISDKVAKFIDENIKNSPLLDDMYDASTKYDQRARVSKKQKELFITLVTNSIESKYAAEHKFNTDVMNRISNFVANRISDKKFIKGAALKYLGKILTIENEAGRITLDKGLSTDVLNLFADAVILASQDYMHKRSFLSDMLDSLRTSENFSNKVAYEIITTWQPFLNSGWNWFVALLDYTPIGIGKGIYQMLKLEKRINSMDEKRARGHLTPDSRVAQYLARRSIGSGVLGTILTALGFLLSYTGIVKLEEDDDDEFKIKIGNIVMDISDVFGTSSLLCGMAIGQIGTKSFVDIIKTMTTETTNGFILIDILDRYQYSYQTDGAYGILLTETESFLKSFIPNIYQQFVRALKNEKTKYSKGMLGLLTRTANAFWPFHNIGEKVVNIYTGETQAKYALPFFGEYLKSGILGIKFFSDYISDEEIFAQKYGVNKGALTGNITIDDVKYDMKDVNSLNTKYGQLNKKALAQLQSSNTTYKVQMPDGSYKNLRFNDMNDKQKANTIDNVMRANAKIAKIYQWTNEGHKYYANSEEYQSLKKLGITTNVYIGDKGFVV